MAVVPNETQGGSEIGDFDGSKPLAQTKASAPKNIPVNFGSSASSPLRHTVVEGDSEFSVDLAE